MLVVETGAAVEGGTVDSVPSAGARASSGSSPEQAAITSESDKAKPDRAMGRMFHLRKAPGFYGPEGSSPRRGKGPHR